MDQELTLLVVDDEEGMRLSIERALRNFTVKTNYDRILDWFAT